MVSDEPVTLTESRIEFASGCRGMLRAASFAVGDGRRSAVTITMLVPDGFFGTIDGGGASVTALVAPDEARRLAQELLETADAADKGAPPLYRD